MNNHRAAVNLLLDGHEQPQHHEEGTTFVSEPCVCKSNAGYYIGTWCTEAVCGQWLPQPYSRDSGYFITEALAQEYIR